MKILIDADQIMWHYWDRETLQERRRNSAYSAAMHKMPFQAVKHTFSIVSPFLENTRTSSMSTELIPKEACRVEIRVVLIVFLDFDASITSLCNRYLCSPLVPFALLELALTNLQHHLHLLVLEQKP